MTILTVRSPFLTYVIGQQITDPTTVASILANPDYGPLVVQSGVPTSGGGSGGGGGSTPTTLNSNHGQVTTDNTTIAINSGNVLYVIPNTSGSAAAIAQLGYTPVNVASISMPNGIAALDASGHLPLSQLTPSVVGALDYKGTWNALTNVPGLLSSVGSKGSYYKVSVAGNTPLDGITSWNINDTIAFNGATWDKIGGSGTGSQVLSFNNRTGVISLTNTDVQVALGFTPYNSSNPAGYVTASQIAAASPVISFNTRVGAIALTSGDVTSALTFTPYNATNPANYITLAQSIAGAAVKSFNARTGIISLTLNDVTAALAFTPYNATNPAGYITAAQVPAGGAVISVAGRIGAITLTASDISGLATVASSGSFTNLINRPLIPSATSQLTNDAMFISAGGAPVQSVNSLTGNVVLKTSQLVNDAGFLTTTTASVTSVNGLGGDVVLPEIDGTLMDLAISSLTNDVGYIAASGLGSLNISNCLVTVNTVTQTISHWLAQITRVSGHILNSTSGQITMTDGSILAF
jgi:hypothetical protein